MDSLADAVLNDILMTEAKRLDAQTVAIFVQENILKEELNHSTWRFFAWEMMTANRAAANNINTSMARAELAGTVIREGRRPMSELDYIFGLQHTRYRINCLRAVLTDMLEPAKYQSWENDIQALLLDLDKIEKTWPARH